MTASDDLITRFGLAPHPEGGWYRETFRSPARIAAHGGERPASTAILFLLRAGEVSRWHRVRSDEVWHWHGGSTLELVLCEGVGKAVHVLSVGPPSAACEPQAVVPAGWWQAARPVGDFALVGCTVAPGFDFADFTLIDPAGPDAAWLRTRAEPRLVDGILQ